MMKIYNILDDVLNIVRPPKIFKGGGGGGIKNVIKNNNNLITTIVKRKNIPKIVNNHKIISNNKKFFNNNNINKVAQYMGFKNADEFNNYIKTVNPYKLDTSQVNKLSKIFNYLSKIAKKTKGKNVAKLAIAGGTLSAMIIYLKKIQNKYNGCFRYDNDDNDEIKYKFVGSFCINTGDDDDYDDVKLISEEEHPLYNVEKWDCKYDKFEKGNKRVDEILQLGCRGLCDWKNFNILAKTTKGEYEPISISDKYTYKCETMTLLKALSSSTGNVIDEIFSGILFSDLGKNLSAFLFHLSCMFMLIIAIIIIIRYNKKIHT